MRNKRGGADLKSFAWFIRRAGLSLAVILPIFINPLAAHAETNSLERIGKIRAALLYYIVKFVEFHDLQGETIQVCIAGSDPLRSYITETVAGKSVYGRSIRVLLLEGSLSQILNTQCHVVFFGSDVIDNSKNFIDTLRTQGVLTICAARIVTWGRCVIEIFEENNKSRIAVDLDNKAEQHFKISSELLEVSLLNRGKENGT